MKQRLVVPGDTLDDEAFVVRGGELVVEVLRRDAQRMWDIYGVFGISVFAVQGTTIDELAQGSPLVRFATLTTLVVRAIRFTGMEIEATGRNRLHYMVLLPDLDVVDDDGQVHFTILPGSVAKNRHLLGRTVA